MISYRAITERSVPPVPLGLCHPRGCNRTGTRLLSLGTSPPIRRAPAAAACVTSGARWRDHDTWPVVPATDQWCQEWRAARSRHETCSIDHAAAASQLCHFDTIVGPSPRISDTGLAGALTCRQCCARSCFTFSVAAYLRPRCRFQSQANVSRAGGQCSGVGPGRRRTSYGSWVHSSPAAVRQASFSRTRLSSTRC